MLCSFSKAPPLTTNTQPTTLATPFLPTTTPQTATSTTSTTTTAPMGEWRSENRKFLVRRDPINCPISDTTTTPKLPKQCESTEQFYEPTAAAAISAANSKTNSAAGQQSSAATDAQHELIRFQSEPDKQWKWTAAKLPAAAALGIRNNESGNQLS